MAASTTLTVWALGAVVLALWAYNLWRLRQAEHAVAELRRELKASRAPAPAPPALVPARTPIERRLVAVTRDDDAVHTRPTRRVLPSAHVDDFENDEPEETDVMEKSERLPAPAGVPAFAELTGDEDQTPARGRVAFWPPARPGNDGEPA